MLVDVTSEFDPFCSFNYRVHGSSGTAHPRITLDWARFQGRAGLQTDPLLKLSSVLRNRVAAGGVGEGRRSKRMENPHSGSSCPSYSAG